MRMCLQISLPIMEYIRASQLIISALLGISLLYPLQTGATKVETKILILGAGPAGLQAAHVLLEKNVTDFIIVEGTDHIGGLSERLVDFGGIQINAGYFFPSVQNEGDLEKLEKLGVEVYRYDWNSWEVRNDQGENITSEANVRYADMEAIATATHELAEGVLSGDRPDLDQKTAMAMKGWLATTPLDKVLQWYFNDFYLGIQMDRMSLVGPYTQNTPYTLHLKDHGDGLYSDVKAKLDKDHLHNNIVVHTIDYSTGDKVLVETTGVHTNYLAEYVLVTFSLGVLQQGAVTFTPPLPEWKTEQVTRYQRGTIEGILLKFASKFWTDAEWIIHASDRQDLNYHHYPAFFNMDREGIHPGSNILVAFVTSDEAVRVEGLTDEQVTEEILDVLNNMYGEENVSELQEMPFERWATDPFNYGMLTTFPVPADVPADAQERLAANVGRVFFAEQSGTNSTGFSEGTVEAATDTATKMLTCKAGGECEEFVETPYWPKMECEGSAKELYGCVLIQKKDGKSRKDTIP